MCQGVVTAGVDKTLQEADGGNPQVAVQDSAQGQNIMRTVAGWGLGNVRNCVTHKKYNT